MRPLGCESSQIPIPMHVTLSFMMAILLCMVSNDDDGNKDGKNDGNCTFVA